MRGTFWFNLLAAVIVLALIQGFIVKLYAVPSGSMEDTLDVGDRILVNRLAYVGSGPTTGDIIVFNASEDTWGENPNISDNPLKNAVKWVTGLVGIGPSLNHTLVKRVIAGPGQTVSCCDVTGRMLVDGEPLSEPYVSSNFDFTPGALDCDSEPRSRRCVPEYTVPEGQYVVLGDNRAVSSDSLWRCRGKDNLDGCVRTVSRGDVVGKFLTVAWPLD